MGRALLGLYSWQLPRQLLRMLAACDYRVGRYLKRFWQTNDLSRPIMPAQPVPLWAAVIVYIGIAAETAAGAYLIWLGRTQGWSGGLEFGLALILAYPLVWAHLLVIPVLLRQLLRPKAAGKAALTALLSVQVRRLRKRHTFTVVAVAGSVGKTSTKVAISRLLGASHAVRWQAGNYNDPLTVPLVFFGHTQPGIFDVFAWARILLQNELLLRRPYPYEYVIAELGTDTPGTIAQFAYLQPELVVITAVTPEHMQSFGTLDGVAREELSALGFAAKSLVNIDDVPKSYLRGRRYVSYGLSSNATYYAGERASAGLKGQRITFNVGKAYRIKRTIPLLGEPGAKIAVAAVAAAHLLGLGKKEIVAGLGTLDAFAGRMQILRGVQNTVLIDDTYNASPAAFRAALDVLYDAKASQRIAIMGGMNELGEHAPQAHREVGAYCDPAKLGVVVTVGEDAKKYLAPAAEAKGCTVRSFLSPYEAGTFVRGMLKEGAVVLAKGSQDGIFVEEALKILLNNPTDTEKLVRQSAYWRTIKAKQFK